MRIVVIGDVGVVDDMVHLGDEAMFDAMVEALRARGADAITGISSAPAETAARYGMDAVGRIGFAGARAEMQARFDAVLAAADGHAALPLGDPAWAVLEAVAAADAIVVAGGGNMASNWPMHVFERAALGAIARRLGRPVVVSGQTLGPRLDAADRDLVGGLLRAARLVGVRELPSARLAARLGVPSDRLAANRDDASFLGLPDDAAPDDATPAILVSLSVHLGGLRRDEAVPRLAASLDALADRTGLPLAFHPHFGSRDPGTTAGDEVLHEAIRGELRAASVALQPGDPRPAARLARGAAMLVTSRYHPAVFAAPAGVPIAALSADDYTAVKLRGATGWWDQDGVVDLAVAASPAGGEALVRVWDARAAARTAAAAARPVAEAASAAWFDRVVDALS